jgi:hypothetical protein
MSVVLAPYLALGAYSLYLSVDLEFPLLDGFPFFI